MTAKTLVGEMDSTHSVTVNSTLEDGRNCFSVKLQGGDFEINVVVGESDLKRLKAVATAKWSARESLRLGHVLGSPAFWSCEDGRLSVLAGPDDECWEVGVFLPEAAVNELVAEIDRETASSA